MKFNTQYERIVPMSAETNYAASETIPDDSLSIPEILSKYIRGQRVDGSFASGFEDPEEGVTESFDELFDGPKDPPQEADKPTAGADPKPAEKQADSQKADE